MGELTRLGPFYQDIKSGPVTWIESGPMGDKVGWCEMTQAHFAALCAKPGLECSWVLMPVEHNAKRFPIVWHFSSSQPAYTVIGWGSAPVERGTHLCGHYFPAESSALGKFFFFFQ